MATLALFRQRTLLNALSLAFNVLVEKIHKRVFDIFGTFLLIYLPHSSSNWCTLSNYRLDFKVWYCLLSYHIYTSTFRIKVFDIYNCLRLITTKYVILPKVNVLHCGCYMEFLCHIYFSYVAQRRQSGKIFFLHGNAAVAYRLLIEWHMILGGYSAPSHNGKAVYNHEISAT